MSESGDLLLFDSLVHVTTDGTWFTTAADASLGRLQREMELASPSKACVVGIDGYNMPNAFLMAVCRSNPDALVPIAGLTPGVFTSRDEAIQHVAGLRQQGFRGVKIHPTFGNVHLDTVEFDWTMEACARASMPVFLCTIMRRRGYIPSISPIDLVYKTFVRHSEVRVLFLHSGMSDLLSYADLVRALPKSLMDLSLTLMKYAGSSLDLDFHYLLANMDQRCVVGSDFPEYTPSQVRERLRELGKNIPIEKIENVAWRNLTSFIGPYE